MYTKAKKLIGSSKDKTEILENIIDEINARGHEVVRFRNRERYKCTTVTRVRGFQVFGTDGVSRGRRLIKGPAEMFPSVDGHMYGYVPATEANLALLAEMFSCKRFVLDDPDFQDTVIAIAEKKGLPTTYVPKVDKVVLTPEEEKLNELESLRKQLELKNYDAEIAELKRQLAGDTVEIVVEKPKAPTKAASKE
jgi:hypothetical protein